MTGGMQMQTRTTRIWVIFNGLFNAKSSVQDTILNFLKNLIKSIQEARRVSLRFDN